MRRRVIHERLARGPNLHSRPQYLEPHSKKKQREKESFQWTHSPSGRRHNRYPYL